MKKIRWFGQLMLANISLILMIMALTTFTVAGFLFCKYVGLIVLGLSLIYLSWITANGKGGE